MPSQRQQIEAIQRAAEQLVQAVDDLVEQMGTGLSNMPESVQEGARGQAIQEKIDTLNDWSDSLQGIVDDVL